MLTRLRAAVSALFGRSTQVSPSLSDTRYCENAIFEWAESYDTKDWTCLRQCLAPTLLVDYTAIMNKRWDAMPAEDFVTMISSPNLLGDASVKTQHLLGASKWMYEGGRIIARHQMRVAHQRYTDESCKEVVCAGIVYGTPTVLYEKVDGTWRIAGLIPEAKFTQGDLEKVFPSFGIT